MIESRLGVGRKSNHRHVSLRAGGVNALRTISLLPRLCLATIISRWLFRRTIDGCKITESVCAIILGAGDGPVSLSKSWYFLDKKDNPFTGEGCWSLLVSFLMIIFLFNWERKVFLWIEIFWLARLVLGWFKQIPILTLTLPLVFALTLN